MRPEHLSMVEQYLRYLQDNGGVDWMHEGYVEQCRELECFPRPKYQGRTEEVKPGPNENENGPENWHWRLSFGIKEEGGKGKPARASKKKAEQEKRCFKVYSERFQRMLSLLKHPKDIKLMQTQYEELCARNGLIPFDLYDGKKKYYPGPNDPESHGEQVREAKLAMFEGWGHPE